MLAPTANTARFLKLTQFLLSFISVCAIADSSRIDNPPADRPGYYADAAQQRDAERDRRFGDLARTERKRREAEQHASRRRAAFGAAWSVDRAEKRAFGAASGVNRGPRTDSRICATCRVSETLSARGMFYDHQDQLLALPQLVACVLQPPA